MDVLFYFVLGGLVITALAFVRNHMMSFVAQTPDDYVGHGPDFDIRKHLNGPILCEGVIYGPTGRVASRFVADFDVKWDGDTGIMTEHFRYDSGETQDREWQLTIEASGAISATADDVVGTGRGKVGGPALLLNYRLRLPEDSGGHVLTATDWMYLMENGTIINRSQFRKFGFKVAELVATMRPADASNAAGLSQSEAA